MTRASKDNLLYIIGLDLKIAKSKEEIARIEYEHALEFESNKTSYFKEQYEKAQGFTNGILQGMETIKSYPTIEDY